MRYGDFSADDQQEGYKVSLDNQRLEQRKAVFSYAKWFCIACYGLFLAFLWKLHEVGPMLKMVQESPHLLIVGMALLIVPSIILWTVIRAVYHSDNGKDTVPLLEIISKLSQN